MSHSRLWLTLGLAVAVGLFAGFAIFRIAGPLPFAAGQPSTPSPSAPPATSASPSPTPTASPSVTPSPTPKATKSAKPARTTAPPRKAPSPSVSTPPPFTEAALLQPAQFSEHGWDNATQTRFWDGFADEQITACTEVTAADGPVESAYAATYAGNLTVGAETVVRFTSTAAAEKAVIGLLDRIDVCVPAGGESTGLKSQPMTPPAAEGLDELYLWNTTGEPNTEGVVGLARAGDRLALVSLTSDETDPAETTEVRPLMLQAGRRLV